MPMVRLTEGVWRPTCISARTPRHGWGINYAFGRPGAPISYAELMTRFDHTGAHVVAYSVALRDEVNAQLGVAGESCVDGG
jgi:hypothetical protein